MNGNHLGANSNYFNAINRYQELRKIVYDVTMDEFPGIIAKEFRFVDAKTADNWKFLTEPNARSSKSTWEWQQEYPFYQNRPKRFEITLWRGGVLGAVCFGQLSMHNTRLRMNLIESTPIRPSPLGARAFPIISFAAAAFARIVGVEELWLIDPSPKLESFYVSEGFSQRERYHGSRYGQRRIL